MALRYGRAKKADLENLGPILALSFGFPPEHAGPWLERTKLENVRVMREGKTIVGGVLLIPMGQYFGGRSVRCYGIAGVGVSPSARGRGVASDMMRRALRELRRDGVALSSLYPASIPLYRRAGYELAGGSWQYTLEGRDMPIRTTELVSREYEPADERQVRAVYAAFAKDRNGWMDRGPYVWERTRRPHDGKPTYGHVFLRGKRIEGYVFYRHKQTPLGFELRVSDMAARSAAGLRDVMTFLGGHKSLADAVKWYGGVDDPWLHLLEDRHYAVKLHHHWMLRIVDIPSALASRGYPKDLNIALTLDVRDDVMPVQSKSYRLSVSAGEAKVRTVSGGGLRMDVRTLAALYSRHMDAHAAHQLGLLEGRSSAIERAGAIFSGPAPSMNDMF